MPNIRDYPPATSLLSTDAFVIDRIGIGTEYIEGINFIPTTLIWAGNAFYEGSSPPGSAQYLGGWSMPVKVTFPANYTAALAQGWGAHSETAPTSNFVITIQLNDVLAATLTMNTDNTFTYLSASGLAWVANIHDRVTAKGPTSVDATMNNFFFTMVGTLTS